MRAKKHELLRFYWIYIWFSLLLRLLSCVYSKCHFVHKVRCILLLFSLLKLLLIFLCCLCISFFSNFCVCFAREDFIKKMGKWKKIQNRFILQFVNTTIELIHVLGFVCVCVCVWWCVKIQLQMVDNRLRNIETKAK